MTNLEPMARLMWDAYARRAGGVTFDGKPLPTWVDLGEDRQACWMTAAETAYDYIKLDLAIEIANEHA